MVPLATVAIFAMYRCIVALSNPICRARTVAAVSRIWRWEFWPAWLFYLPIVVYIVAKSIRRGGLQGFANITAANPGIPHGGLRRRIKAADSGRAAPCFGHSVRRPSAIGFTCR